MTHSESKRINNAKKYPYLGEMHPEDRADYLAGKYTKAAKLRFLCDVCGEYYVQSPKERQKGSGHAACSHKRGAIIQRVGEDYHSFADLSPEYQEKCRNKELTRKSRVDFVCNACGKIYNTILGSHEPGGCCGSCASRTKRLACQPRTDYAFMDDICPRDRARIRRGELNNHSKVRIKCSECGEYFSQQILSREQGFTRCRKCADAEKGVARRRREYDFINPLREDYAKALVNGELYTGSRVVFVCPVHGEYTQKLMSAQKHGCQACSMGLCPHSLYEFLLTLTDNITVNDREQIRPKEIDFYLPDYNIGFEFNDIKTHQTLFARQEASLRNHGGKPYDYHIKKWQMAKEKGITLMHVWDVDWQDDIRREKIKSIIVSLLRGEKVAETNRNMMKFYEYKTRVVIERSPQTFREMRDKCISGEAARFYTCGIII